MVKQYLNLKTLTKRKFTGENNREIVPLNEKNYYIYMKIRKNSYILSYNRIMHFSL